MRILPPSLCFSWIVRGALVAATGSLHAASVVTYPYRGVTQIVRTETSPRPEHINVMQIDLTTPGIRFLVSKGNNPVDATNREVTAAKTLDYMTAQNAQIAINAHFFQVSDSGATATKWVVGLAASQGYVYSSFEGPTPAAANPVNSLSLTQDYAIMTNVPALNIDAQNKAQIVHYDAGNADKKHVLESVTLYNAVCGSAQIVTNGVKSIPTYTGNVATGLITNGTYSDGNSWYNAVNARTAIGLSADNRTLTLFTIDAAGGSSGMTVGEVADMLRTDYQVWNALNLDGGGSTTMALQDPVTKTRSVINSSSNGSTPRIVATSLVVFADPQIAVEQPSGTNLTSGGPAIDCGSANIAGKPTTLTFTVRSSGAADLSGLAVTKTGANAAEFTVSALGATTLAATTSTPFTVTFTPTAAGTRSATIHIASNDATKNPFDINLTGTGVATSVQAWRMLHFGSYDNSGDGADLNDYCKDGLPNLIKFALGLDPKLSGAGLLPSPQRSENGLTLGFNQPAGVTGITYSVESSETMLPDSWSALPDTGTSPQHSFSVPVGGKGMIYMRIKVTSP